MKNAVTVLSGLAITFLLFPLFLFGQASSGEYPEYKFIKTQGEYSLGALLGTIRFQGRSTARGFVDGAQIRARISGAPADGIIPSSLYFLTGEDQLYNRVVINEKGYLGVNDDSPMSRMSIKHFYSASDAPDFSIFSVEGGATGAVKRFQLNTTNNGSTLNGLLEGNLWIREGNAQVDGGNVIVPSGRIVVGTDEIENDEYILQVKGGIKGTKVQVLHVNNWPDYVFAPDYKLPNLHDLEQFIKQYHHLPGIPVAREVEKAGIDLAEMQAKLLEKVEELTLLAIQQEKTIEELTQHILNQDKKVDAIIQTITQQELK